MKRNEHRKAPYEGIVADVVIIGGGPAGLSAALVLGRSLRKVIVIDEGKPRNAASARSHGYLTRDGVAPTKFHAIAHDELASYDNVTRICDTVVDVQLENGLYRAMMQAHSSVKAPKIIFATGIKDHLPPIAGLAEVYGTSVFPCPYCDGWERANAPLAVFDIPEGNEKANHLFDYVKLIYNWSKDIVVFTNGPAALTSEQRSKLTARNVQVIEEPVLELQSMYGQLKGVRLANDMIITRSGGFLTNTGGKQASMIPAKLGAKLANSGGYETKGHGKTDVKGLFIIGDAETTFSGLIGAAADGYETGTVINHELIEEEWRQA